MDIFKKEIVKQLKPFLPLNEKEIQDALEVPPNNALGDYAFPCFTLTKTLKKSPNLIAQEIRDKIKKSSFFSKIENKGAYINFFLTPSKLAEITLKEIKKQKYVRKSQKKRIVVEFPSPNTNKPLHVGHLRNLTIGEALSRILEFQGNKIYRVTVNNDRGTHICKSMLAYQKFGKNKHPNKKPDHFVGDFYVLFAQKAKENPKLEQEAQEMLRKWEHKDLKVTQLWKKMNAWAYRGFNQTYKAFDATSFDKAYYESNLYTHGKEIVQEGVKKKIFQKEEDGAISVDLGEPLGKKILTRKDGTSLYITQDLYLASLKYKDFRYDQSIYVVANEQDYHFQVLFKILKLLKNPFAESCYHLSYGMVHLPEGRMKSREGKVVDADEVISELMKMAKNEIKKRDASLSSKEIEKRAHSIALAAIKYYLIKSDIQKDLLFNPEEAVSFEGDTGPYLQYTYARTSSILRKAKKLPEKTDFSLLQKQEEINLIQHLSKFPEIVEEASIKLKPNLIANYAFTLSQFFNEFYHSCPVLTAETGLKNARISLLKAFQHVLKNSLTLLNITPLEKM